MKIIKRIIWAIVILLGLALAAVLSLPLWIGFVAPPVANAIVPTKTGTAFRLGSLSLNPYTGCLSLGGVQLENPTDFDPRSAVTLEEFSVSVDVGTVASDTIVIRDILVRNVFVSYVSNKAGANNFDVIAANAGGEKAQSDATSAKGADKAKPADDKASKKVIIDHVRIEGVSVQWGAVTVPVPTLDLTGIGRNTMGVTLEDAWNQIYRQILKSSDKLGTLAVDAAAQALKEAKIAPQTVDAAMQAVKAAGLDRKANEAITKALGATSDATGNATAKSIEAAKKTLGVTGDATGAATKKALDATGAAADGLMKDAGKALNGLFGK